MRISQKKQLLQLIDTLKDAHVVIKEYIENQNYERTIEMLVECQDAAIHIGNAIEDIEGDGLPVIRNIEEYCESLYQISINVNISCPDNSYKTLKHQIDRIEASINNEIAVYYEIVFIPYKASMWDSLESIWQAANEDKQCICYVIPVPYFDRTLEGGFGEMHYEGALMPDYVPITDFRDYNLFERRPDVIYFCNPYDQYNSATSVHPDFYSSKLKKYTDMLIYVPYFVSVDNVPEHLCIATGVFNADRVIVQSDKDKEIYSNVLKNVLTEKLDVLKQMTGIHDSQYWEELKKSIDTKFLALGSPKFDKVLKTRREDVELPEEWKKVIYAEDGNRKKVIFYNTTIKTLIDNKKRMLDKIRETITIFSENKDVVLLWRPHPLSEATLASMDSELLIEYQRIINQFKNEGWGIYDDTADLNRTIALSDAYYGDWSSVVALYKVTGKPIMIQNVEVLSK